MSLAVFFLLFGALAVMAFVAALYASVRHAFGDRRPGLGASAISLERQRLLEEKAALLRSIKDLEFDRDAGKIDEDDFAKINEQLRRRGREVLQHLDVAIEPYRAEARALIDRAIVHEGIDLVCKACGVKNDEDATFCKKCGKRVGDAPEEAAP